MKKIFGMIAVAVVMAMICGCEKAKSVEDPKIKGEWKVINKNCPEILAEKNGERKIFRFRTPYPYTGIERARLCKQVQPGWTIEVISENEYSFFPAISTPNSK